MLLYRAVDAHAAPSQSAAALALPSSVRSANVGADANFLEAGDWLVWLRGFRITASRALYRLGPVAIVPPVARQFCNGEHAPQAGNSVG